MILGEIKSQIDRIWDAFWSGSISNLLEVIEQTTYQLFLRRLDEAVEKLKTAHRTLSEDALFASLQHRAFQGDL